MNKTQQLQAIVKRYGEEVRSDPVSMKEVAAWAIQQRLWQPYPADFVSQCADELSRALREEYRIDKNGNKYRAKHAVRISSGGAQLTLWADIDTAPRSYLEKAFGQRRQQIVGDCYQLKMDVDYYNDSYAKEKPIQLVLDFTMGVLERQLGNEEDDKKAA